MWMEIMLCVPLFIFSEQNMCTDLNNFPHLLNNSYEMVGSSLSSTTVSGLLHCVHECGDFNTCSAFTFHTQTRTCSLYSAYASTGTINTGPLLLSVMTDWPQISPHGNNQTSTSPTSSSTMIAGSDCYVMQGALGFYNGTVNVTVNGTECQRWDSQTPHTHTFGTTANDFATGETMTSVSNYCRVSLTDTEPQPWCYTINPTIRWHTCDIPECP